MKFGKLMSVIRWKEADSSIIVYKHPETNFNTKTRLIVADSQEAIFRHNGKGQDVFGPGDHTLDTENLPILSSLLKIPYGGKSPFTAEVWFINKISFLSVGWGTASPINCEDPKLKVMAQIKAYGQFGMDVIDSKKFLDRLAGTQSFFTIEEVQDAFRGILLQQFTVAFQQALINSKASLLEVSYFLNHITEQVEKFVVPKFDQYGVEFHNFTIEALNIDPESESELRRIKSERADIDTDTIEQEKLGFTYQERRSFDVMETAAGNEGGEGGSLRNDMMGMGMGVAMGGGMGQMMNNMMENITNPNKNLKLPGESAQNYQKTEALTEKKCTNCFEPLPKGVKFCAGCGQAVPQASQELTCNKCNEQIPANSKFCPSCGTPVVLKCKSCGVELSTGTKFCPECGTKQ